MNWDTVSRHFHPRDIVRNMMMYEFTRSILLLAVKHQWPNYSEVVLDAFALSVGGLDSPETRSWPRMIVSFLFVEGIRYLYHHPHLR